MLQGKKTGKRSLTTAGDLTDFCRAPVDAGAPSAAKYFEANDNESVFSDEFTVTRPTRNPTRVQKRHDR